MVSFLKKFTRGPGFILLSRFGLMGGLCASLGCSTGPQSSAKETTPSGSKVILPDGVTSESVRVHSARGQKVIVSTQGKATTQAAIEVLQNGGNLVDAAIAASFTVSVERPQSTGIGGGGFLIYRKAPTKQNPAQVFVYDFRERAPKAATKTMFLDREGNVVEGLSTEGALSVGVPGLVAGMEKIHRRHGKMKWKRVLSPSVRLAREGFPIYPYLAAALKDKKELLSRYEDSRKIFLNENGQPREEGEILVQTDLARTLDRLSKEGARAFYKRGKIRDSILKVSRKLKGILSEDDFENYRVKERKPVQGRFLNYEVISMPPPSSGGVHVLQILGMVEKTEFQSWGYMEPKTIHALASAMQSSFADRAEYLGDPDFIKVPVQELLSQSYIEKRVNGFRWDQARKKAEVLPGLGPFSGARPKKEEHPETTHFSMMDEQGNVVVSTQTINEWFGSGVVAPGTGIVLNNEMDDFAAKVGVPNSFGALGADANAVEPGKTPLSSMSPTIVIDENGKPVMALGAPGGTRILTCVAQTIINHLGLGLSLEDSVASIRLHHQWSPDRLDFDSPGPGESVISTLTKMGYEIRVKPGAVGCRVMAVGRENGNLIGVSDPRDAGTAAGL